MKITASSLQLASSHQSSQVMTSKESLRVWTGNQRPENSETADFRSENGQPGQGRVLLSAAGRAAAAEAAEHERQARAKAREAEARQQQATAAGSDTAGATGEAGSVASTDANIDNDPKLRMIRSMIEAITGKAIRILDSSDLEPGKSAGHDSSDHHAHEAGGHPARAAGPETGSLPATPPQRAGYGVEYDYESRYSESEQMHFSASGRVSTADGKEIAFQVELNMQRSFSSQESLHVRMGDAVQVDPLVINFSGQASGLTDSKFSFDLDSDGDKEKISFVQPGSGFLVFDRNQDGVVNDGSELFGPQSGNGFAELARLDDDQNGWIDEGDKAYDQLQVWSRDAAGKDQLQGLKSANVGAISLKNVETSFNIKDAENVQQGTVRQTGVFLKENGGAGTVSQIDLNV